MPRPTEAEITKFFRDADARITSFGLDAGRPAIMDSEGNPAPGSETTRWHQIALVGEWKGHYMGPFKLTAEDFASMIFIFESLENDMVVDYEHNTYNPFALEAPAAAWIDGMKVQETSQGPGLFARFKWTKPAAARLDAREYRYLSPTILRRTRDRKTGKDLGPSIHSVALTNTPFLDELPEVALNSSWIARLSTAAKPEDKKMNDQQMALLAVALGLKADASAEQITAAVSTMARDVAGLEAVSNALGLEGGSVDAMCATAQGLREENDNLRVKANKADELAAEQMIRQARDEGKITADNEVWCTKLAKENPSMFSEWLAAAPKVVAAKKDPPKTKTKRDPTKRLGEQRLADAIAEMEPEDYDAAERCGMTPETWAKHNIDELLSN